MCINEVLCCSLLKLSLFISPCHMLLSALSVVLLCQNYQTQFYSCSNLDGEMICIPVDYTNISTLGGVPGI